jgi:hypothetical protein
MLLLALTPVQLYSQSFGYKNFVSTAGLRLNGEAEQATPIPPEIATVLRITHGYIGSAWYNRAVPLADGFTVNYSFNVNSCFPPSCADGYAFVIQNAAAGTLAIGGWGGELGYGYRPPSNGIENSLAVEFDNYINPEYSDPSANHVAAQSCGTAPNDADHKLCNLSITSKLGMTLTDAANHAVEIAYVPGNLYTSIDGRLIMTTPVTLDTLLSLNAGSAYIGFTGANGSLIENVDILNWSYSTRYNATAVISSSLNPSTFGQPVTFTATVTARYSGLSAPTGQVKFYDGGAFLGTVDLLSGVATFTTSDLTVGSHNIGAVYGGDPVFNPRTLRLVVQVVN